MFFNIKYPIVSPSMSYLYSSVPGFLIPLIFYLYKDSSALIYFIVCQKLRVTTREYHTLMIVVHCLYHYVRSVKNHPQHCSRKYPKNACSSTSIFWPYVQSVKNIQKYYLLKRFMRARIFKYFEVPLCVASSTKATAHNLEFAFKKKVNPSTVPL
jgi:hypothetical protein